MMPATDTLTGETHPPVQYKVVFLWQFYSSGVEQNVYEEELQYAGSLCDGVAQSVKYCMFLLGLEYGVLDSVFYRSVMMYCYNVAALLCGTLYKYSKDLGRT